MAVINPNDPNQQNPTQPQSNGLGMGQAAPAQPKGSGRFTNLQKYVTANQGAGEKLGQKIGSQVSGQAQQVREGIQSAKTGFQQQVDTENQRIAQGQNLTQQAMQDVSGFVNDPNKLAEFQKIREAQTAQIDPLQLQQEQQRAAIAQQMAQNANTEQGRFQLLKGAFANPRYTTGLGRLDQLFLQSSPALKELQQQSKAVTQGLGSEIGEAQQYSQEQIAARDAQAKAAQDFAMSQIGREDDPTTPEDESAGAFGTFGKDIFGRINTEQDKLNQAYQNIMSKFDAIPNQGPAGVQGKAQTAEQLGTHKAKSVQELFQNLTPEEQQLLGLDKNMVIGNMSLDEFKSYLKDRQLSNTEVGRFFSPEEYAKYQAYGKLMGTGTRENLSKDQQALIGQGLGDTSFINSPQFQQQIAANEAALWSGGYLNDINDLIAGYDRVMSAKGSEIKNEVQLDPVNNYLRSLGIQNAYGADNSAVQEAIMKSFMGNDRTPGIRPGLNPYSPEAQAEVQNILTKVNEIRDQASRNWREGQLRDRARQAGMLQTLGGTELTAEQLRQRYQSFKDKGII